MALHGTMGCNNLGIHPYLIDVLWGQWIKLIQVASNSELDEKSMEQPSFL